MKTYTTILALAAIGFLSACSDSHDVTTTDVNINSASEQDSAMKWHECDDYIGNMYVLHGTPTYVDTHNSDAYEVLGTDYYFYSEANLRFEVTNYRNGTCQTFTTNYNA